MQRIITSSSPPGASNCPLRNPAGKISKNLDISDYVVMRYFTEEAHILHTKDLFIVLMHQLDTVSLESFKGGVLCIVQAQFNFKPLTFTFSCSEKSVSTTNVTLHQNLLNILKLGFVSLRKSHQCHAHFSNNASGKRAQQGEAQQLTELLGGAL